MKEKEKMLEKNNMTLELEKMVKNSIAENQISRNELSKKKSLQEKGITLIALVVTIIILLILAGVTLNIALSDGGLFSKTKEATEKYKQAQSDEEEMIRQISTQMYSEYVGAEVTGYAPTGGKYEITGEQSGTEEEEPQTFTTEGEKDNLQWRIWDYDGTTLRIILDKVTTQKLKLKGLTGYNNGVYLINEVCRKCFGRYNGDEMETGINVANLKRSDIEKVSTFDYTSYGKNDENIQYGSEKTVDGSCTVPNIWYNYDSKWNYKLDEDNEKWSGNPSCEDPWEKEFKLVSKKDEGIQVTNLKIKANRYYNSYDRASFINDSYFNILYDSSLSENGHFSFLLATRCVRFEEEEPRFGVARLDHANENEEFGVHESDICKLGGDEIEGWTAIDSLRPVVSINLKTSKYSLVKNTDGGNSEEYKLIEKNS